MMRGGATLARAGIAVLLAVLLSSGLTSAAAPGSQGAWGGGQLAATPPMGFNSWAGFACRPEMNESLYTRTADQFIALGLDRLGYEYINVDDCWMRAERGPDGNLQVDTGRFPHGMKWLAGYLHARGLKLGLYESAGYRTCKGRAGSYGHFQQDADLYASWGVDYLKLDYCHPPTDRYPGVSAGRVAQIVYTQASLALAGTGRPIVFSESAPAYFCCTSPAFRQILTWVGHQGQLWRFGTDIADRWSSVMRNYRQGNTPGLAELAGPGRWNDADMLEVGNGGLNLTEQQSQFTLWAMMASPLLLSTRLDRLSPAELAIINNPRIIAVDQDPLGHQARIVAGGSGYDVLSRPLAGGDYAVALFNYAGRAQTVSTSARAAGVPAAARYRLTDLVTGATAWTGGVISAVVPPHGTVIYRVRA